MRLAAWCAGAFEEQRMALMQKPGNQMQNFREMITRHIAEVEQFLLHEARDNDRFNGRLMLVDMHMSLAQIEQARDALLKMNADDSPALILLVAADIADRLGLKEQRGTWRRRRAAKGTDDAVKRRHFVIKWPLAVSHR